MIQQIIQSRTEHRIRPLPLNIKLCTSWGAISHTNDEDARAALRDCTDLIRTYNLIPDIVTATQLLHKTVKPSLSLMASEKSNNVFQDKGNRLIGTDVLDRSMATPVREDTSSLHAFLLAWEATGVQMNRGRCWAPLQHVIIHQAVVTQLRTTVHSKP